SSRASSDALTPAFAARRGDEAALTRAQRVAGVESRTRNRDRAAGGTRVERRARPFGEERFRDVPQVAVPPPVAPDLRYGVHVAGTGRSEPHEIEVARHLPSDAASRPRDASARARTLMPPTSGAGLRRARDRRLETKFRRRTPGFFTRRQRKHA